MSVASVPIYRFLGLAAIVLPVAALAQVPEPTAPPIPSAPVIVLPTLTPTPTPSTTLTPQPTATPAVEPTVAASPTPRATRTVRPAPTAASTPAPGPSPTPAERPMVAAPTPLATPAVAASPSAATVSAPARGEALAWLPWLLGTVGLALLVLLWTQYRRAAPQEPLGEPVAIAPEETPTAVAAAPRASARGPWLTVALRPTRAGLNMVTAVVDCEITVTNEGSEPAEAIRTALALVAAQSRGADAADAGPIVKSVVPAFALAPGEARTFRGVAAAPLGALPTMQAGRREMLVPLVILHLQHRDPIGAEHRLSQGFVVGAERADLAKLAPFWLDTSRMIDQVAARPSGAPRRRRLDAGAGAAGVGNLA